MKKGETLVEVLIALFIFSTVIAASISLYTGMITFYNADASYVHFESICQDIDKYYDHYGANEWCFNYFGKVDSEFYYDNAYQICDKSEAAYVLEIEQSENNLIISVRKMSDGEKTNKYIVDKLEYGVSKYCSILDSNSLSLIGQYYTDNENVYEVGEQFYNDSIEKVTIWGEDVYRYGKETESIFSEDGAEAVGNTFFKVELVKLYGDNNENATFKLSYLDKNGAIKGVITYDYKIKN